MELLTTVRPYDIIEPNCRTQLQKNPNAVLSDRSNCSRSFIIESTHSRRKMSSSEELFREGNAFSGESGSSVSTINLEDYPASEPEIEITGVRQSSPRIGDLPQDQWPKHVRDAPAFSSGYPYVEGNWSTGEFGDNKRADEENNAGKRLNYGIGVLS
ncbi:hypothetical protein PanWU01x14_145150 [Parasponia andersonii]|uniref:Uncharacterized protein n=1 Tax=Parasponia andersonii TaxID=3476 RepID=A0A2P5CKP3_PARAD|nr:hypothetical protein PanWU01x14_145150 [Parasponia andersonii]